MDDIEYVLCNNGTGYYAMLHGKSIGEISFVRVGIDKFMIDHTSVSDDFRNSKIGLNLVRHVCDLARKQHRKIIPMCPFACAMFTRYPEFDDVRLLQSR